MLWSDRLSLDISCQKKEDATMEHRIVKNDDGVSPVIAVILMVAITVVLAAVLYVWAASFLEQGESAPIATYFLKDDTGSTYVGGNGFGEIAMQIVGGEEHGIDTSYTGDDDQLKSRATNVSDDDGSVYPVHFSDNDRDDKLSAGDQFMVYGMGNSANGPAADNWKLDIQFDASGDIIGTAKLL